MKPLILIVLISLLTQTSFAQKMSFYDFKMKTIDGKEYDFAQLKGKKVMIVNTASKCGLTPQYASLEELYKEFGGDKFVILGFPANNFAGQEPEDNSTIAEFCQKNFGVTFQMFEKISVKGKDINPLYEWLTQKERNGVSDAKVEWNFHKFLIDENGNWSKSIAATTSPVDEEILKWLGK
ncbi:MAG: Glutathione peroxidase BsaA [Bacteroidia bacterium]|nr:Glutathione peroxidase BsaA [Bacteroidia bacterium]